MCIICVKPSKIALPDHEILKNMWDSNPDGAGMMYVKKNRVIIEKGFMSFKTLEARLKSLEHEIDIVKTPMILHFRIGTHGGNTPENTHPFPITDSIPALKKLRIETPIGIAHNGIIHITPRDSKISDTMEYIASQLAPLHRGVPDFYRNKHLMQMVQNAIDSKMAFLTKDGEIYTIGEFLKDGGIMYSNSSYKTSRKPYRSIYAGNFYPYSDGYDFAYDDYDDFTETVEDLMPLDEDGMYVVDSMTGDFVSCEDDLFAINIDGDVFHYDYEFDAYTPLWNYSAWTSNGAPVRFVREKTNAEIAVYDSCEDTKRSEGKNEESRKASK